MVRVNMKWFLTRVACTLIAPSLSVTTTTALLRWTWRLPTRWWWRPTGSEALKRRCDFLVLWCWPPLSSLFLQPWSSGIGLIATWNSTFSSPRSIGSVSSIRSWSSCSWRDWLRWLWCELSLWTMSAIRKSTKLILWRWRLLTRRDGNVSTEMCSVAASTLLCSLFLWVMEPTLPSPSLSLFWRSCWLPRMWAVRFWRLCDCRRQGPYHRFGCLYCRIYRERLRVWVSVQAGFLPPDLSSLAASYGSELGLHSSYVILCVCYTFL